MFGTNCVKYGIDLDQFASCPNIRGKQLNGHTRVIFMSLYFSKDSILQIIWGPKQGG